MKNFDFTDVVVDDDDIRIWHVEEKKIWNESTKQRRLSSVKYQI